MELPLLLDVDVVDVVGNREERARGAEQLDRLRRSAPATASMWAPATVSVPPRSVAQQRQRHVPLGLEAVVDVLEQDAVERLDARRSACRRVRAHERRDAGLHHHHDEARR